MRKIVLLLICLSLLACSSLSKSNEDKKITVKNTETTEIKEVKEFYKLEVAWEDGKVYDVKLNNEIIENGEGFTLKSSEFHSIKWIVPSMSIELSVSYETDGNKLSSPNKGTELSGKIGMNVKEIKLTEDSYIYIDGTTLKILPLSNIEIPEEKKVEKEFEIFKTENNEDVKVIDKTGNN